MTKVVTARSGKGLEEYFAQELTIRYVPSQRESFFPVIQRERSSIVFESS